MPPPGTDPIAAALLALNASIKELKDSVEDQTSQQSPAKQSSQNKEVARKANKEYIDSLREQIELEEDQEKLTKLLIESKLAQIESEKLSTRSKAEQAAAIKELKKDIEDLTAEIDDNTRAQKEASEAGAGLADRFANLTGVNKDFTKSMAGQVMAVLKGGKGLEQFSKHMIKTFTPLNVFSSIGQKAFETTALYATRLFTEMDSGLAQFNAASGAAGKFDEELAKSASTMVEYGVNLGAIGGALNTLRQAFPDRELGDQSVQVAESFALWEKSGVSVDAATKSYTSLRRSYKMSSEDAMGLQRNIMALGDQIGVGGPKMIADFAAAAPRLSIHGNNMENVFKRVASASSQLGLEIDDVLSLAEGFQTFEGSAQAAGQLNAVLGGGFINNLDLMNAAFEDPAKAAMMIKDAFTSAGESVESLGPAGVKAAAKAAGFSDVGKFTSFLNGEMDAAELAADEGLEMQKDMQASAKRSMTATESIDVAIKELFAPLMPVMQDLAELIKKSPKALKAAVVLGAPIIGSLIGLMVAKALAGPFAATVGNIIASRINPTGNTGGGAAGAPFGGGAFKWGSTMTSGAKMMTGMAALGAVATVGKDVVDLANGDTSSGNTGALVGSVVGGAIGAFAGPMGLALGVTLGNSAGQMFGEMLDEKDKKADAKIEKKLSPEAIRHKELMDVLEAQSKRSQNVKVQLDVDEFAYKKGFKLSTAEIFNGG